MTTRRGSELVHVGARIISADGKQLGIVKEVLTDRFLVDVHWSPDYWLGTDVVDNGTEDILQLAIEKEAVGRAKLNPSLEQENIHGGAEDMGGPSPYNRPPPTI